MRQEAGNHFPVRLTGISAGDVALMIGAWSMNVGGKVYGPFTSERLREFATEGRLAPHSLIAREGTEDWHEARDEPEFAEIFAPGAAEPEAVAVQPQAEAVAVASVAPAKTEIAEGGHCPFCHRGRSQIAVHRQSGRRHRLAGTGLRADAEHLDPGDRPIGQRGAQPLGAGIGQARFAFRDRRVARQGRVVQFRSRSGRAHPPRLEEGVLA
ncbi:MAG: DUF4339 domain-containing protein [Alphaproteobacteria bacterium]|nr:DUF4339 domain-containing protein [Alphaproteobacteria bacterium]